MLALQTLGPIDLISEEGGSLDSVLSQPKRFALLAYLVLAPPGKLRHRDSILVLFWPERDEVRGRNALAQSLYFLRRNLPPGVIFNRGREQVGVEQDAISVDVRVFEVALAEHRWADALEIYGGDFMEGFHVADSPALEEWIALERVRLREEAARGAWSLAREHVQRGALMEAERTAQRAMELVCTDESAVREFIGVLAEAGDRAAALNFFERFRDKLNETLDVDPSPRTQTLVDEIRAYSYDPVPEQLGEGEEAWELGGGPTSPSASKEGKGDDRPAPEARGDGAGRRMGLGAWGLVILGVALVVSSLVLRWSKPGQDGGGAPQREDLTYTIIAEVGGSAPEEIGEVVWRLVADGLVRYTPLRVLPQRQVRKGLEASGKSDTTWITAVIASELAIRGGLGTVLIPELDALGGEYRLAVRALRAEDDSLLAQASGRAANDNDLLAVTDRMMKDLAKGLKGVDNVRGQWQETRSLGWLETSSFAAFRTLMRADTASWEGRFQDATDLAYEALAIDPEFGDAWARLTDYYWNRRVTDSARYAFQQARMRSDRVSDSRMLHAEATVALAEGDLTRHLDLRRRIVLEFGMGGQAYAVALAGLGRHEEAVEKWETFYSEMPFGPVPATIDNIVYWLVALGRFEEAGLWADSLSEDRRQWWQIQLALASARWQRAESLEMTLPEGRMTYLGRASLEAVRGRVGSALSALETRATLAIQDGSLRYAQTAMESALTLAVAAGAPLSLDRAELEADTTERGRRIQGIWAAVEGDTVAARVWASGLPPLPAMASGDLDGHDTQLVLLHARIAHAKEDWREVVRLLAPFTGEHSWRGSVQNPRTIRLTNWTIAEAYDHLERPDSAVLYWARLATSAGLGEDETLLRGFSHSFAHRRAALAYRTLGSKEEALAYWGTFLHDFNDPDPEYEWMVDEALRELARMGGSLD